MELLVGRAAPGLAHVDDALTSLGAQARADGIPAPRRPAQEQRIRSLLRPSHQHAFAAGLRVVGHDVAAGVAHQARPDPLLSRHRSRAVARYRTSCKELGEEHHGREILVVHQPSKQVCLTRRRDSEDHSGAPQLPFSFPALQLLVLQLSLNRARESVNDRRGGGTCPAHWSHLKHQDLKWSANSKLIFCGDPTLSAS